MKSKIVSWIQQFLKIFAWNRFSYISFYLELKSDTFFQYDFLQSEVLSQEKSLLKVDDR